MSGEGRHKLGLQEGLSGAPSMAEVVLLYRAVMVRVRVVYGVVGGLLRAVPMEDDVEPA